MSEPNHIDEPSSGKGENAKRTFKDCQFPKLVSGNSAGRPVKKRSDESMPVPSAHDDVVLKSMRRRVRQKDGSEISVIEAVAAGLGIEALRRDSGDKGQRSSSSMSATKIALAEHRAASASEAAIWQWIVSRKAELESEFENRRRRNLRPPDVVPHPDHVVAAESGTIRMIGPETREAQQAWELMKFHLRSLADTHADLRRQVAANPDDPELRAYLADVEQERRAWMRKVPKGWNWRERVITCDSDAASLLESADQMFDVQLPPKLRAMCLESYRESALVKAFKRR